MRFRSFAMKFAEGTKTLRLSRTIKTGHVRIQILGNPAALDKVGTRSTSSAGRSSTVPCNPCGK